MKNIFQITKKNASLFLYIILLMTLIISPSMLNRLADPDSVPISPTRFQFIRISSDDIFMSVTQNITSDNTPVDKNSQILESKQIYPSNIIKPENDADSTIRTGFVVSVDQVDKKVRYTEKYQMIGTLFDINAAFQYAG